MCLGCDAFSQAITDPSGRPALIETCIYRTSYEDAKMHVLTQHHRWLTTLTFSNSLATHDVITDLQRYLVTRGYHGWFKSYWHGFSTPDLVSYTSIYTSYRSHMVPPCVSRCGFQDDHGSAGCRVPPAEVFHEFRKAAFPPAGHRSREDSAGVSEGQRTQAPG